jgi:hypothetical protein
LLGYFHHGNIQQIQTANGAGNIPTTNGPRNQAAANAWVASEFTSIVPVEIVLVV